MMAADEVVSILLDLKAFHSRPGCNTVVNIIWTSKETNGKLSRLIVSKLNKRNVCKVINPDEAQRLLNDNLKTLDLAVKMYSLCGVKLIRIEYSPLVMVFGHSNTTPLTTHKQDIFHILNEYLQSASKGTKKYRINLQQCPNMEDGLNAAIVNRYHAGSCLSLKDPDPLVVKQHLEEFEMKVDSQQCEIESQLSRQEEYVAALARKLSKMTSFLQEQDANHDADRCLNSLDLQLATAATETISSTTMPSEQTNATVPTSPETSATCVATVTAPEVTTTSTRATNRTTVTSSSFKEKGRSDLIETKPALHGSKMIKPKTMALPNSHEITYKDSFLTTLEISEADDHSEEGIGSATNQQLDSNRVDTEELHSLHRKGEKDRQCGDVEERPMWAADQALARLNPSVSTTAAADDDSAAGEDDNDDDDDDDLYEEDAPYLDSTYVSEPHKYRRKRGKQPKLLLVRTDDGGTESDSAMFAVFAQFGADSSSASDSLMSQELEYAEQGNFNFDEKQIEKHVFGDIGLPGKKETPWSGPKGREQLRSLITHVIGDSPNWSRLSASAEEALLEESGPVPRSEDGMDTVLCLDTSGSMEGESLEHMKKILIEFIDGVETIAKTYKIHENIAIVTFGGRARVIQHLTNDYTRLRQSVSNLTAGGPGPIHEALVVSLACLHYGGVSSIGWRYKLPPRMIFMCDGYPTTELPETVHDTMYISEADKDHICKAFQELQDRQVFSGVPYPIVFVPVGSVPNETCLRSIASYCGGKIASSGAKLAKIQRFHKISSEALLFLRANGVRKTQQESPFYEFITRFANDLTQAESLQIFGMMTNHFDLATMTPGAPGTFCNLYEERELPPLGSRVVRGQDWKWTNQDTEGAGTIINHTNNQLVYVLWDNGHINAYRYGHNGHYDVVMVSDRPKVPETQYPTIGCQVERGPQWRETYDDQDGGKGHSGVVLRRNLQGRILVRWSNGNTFDYKCGSNGRYEVILRDPLAAILEATATSKTDDEHTATGPEVVAKPEDVSYEWQREDGRKGWETYSEEETMKLNKAYARNPLGSCLIRRNDVSFRVSFKALEERRISDVKSHVRIRCVPLK